LDEIAQQRDQLDAKEAEIRARTNALEESAVSVELLHEDIDKERKLLDQKDAGLEQLRIELEKWRADLMDKREQLEAESKKRVTEIALEAANKMERAVIVGDEQLARRDAELRAFEERLRARERDLETRERTVAIEAEKLERDRIEVKDLWDKVEDSKKGIAVALDEKMLKALETRRLELDAAYLKLSEREENLRRDEQRLEDERHGLDSMREELEDIAKVLRSREEEMKRTGGSTA